MIIQLNSEAYKLAKSIDFSEINNAVSFSDEKKTIEVVDESIRTFQLIISEEVDRKGLSDDQNEVTEFGRKLYGLYDEISFQLKRP